MTTRVCFVCSGNICRSPTAEVVFRDLAEQTGADVEVDSAGTGGWHAGDDMDTRSRATLEDAGYRPPTHAARRFEVTDFADRDVVVALDAGHEHELRRMARHAADPDTAARSIVLLRTYDPQADPARDGGLDVGDPYYGGPDGFTEVLAQIERGCTGLLNEVLSRRPTNRRGSP